MESPTKKFRRDRSEPVLPIKAIPPAESVSNVERVPLVESVFDFETILSAEAVSQVEVTPLDELVSQVETIPLAQPVSHVQTISAVESVPRAETIPLIEPITPAETIPLIEPISPLDPILPTNRTKSEQETFAEEVFHYLLNYFGIESETIGEYKFFTEAMGRAIIVLGYTLRRKLWNFIEELKINFSDITEFLKSAQNFKLVMDECYFYRVLIRLSNIFELTIYSLKQGYNYTKNASQIIATDNTVQFFEINGGWFRLNQTAIFVATAGDLLSEITKIENPQDEHLKSFVDVVESLENLDNFPSEHSLRSILISMKKDILSKVGDIRYLDPRVLKVFCMMLCQPHSNVYIMNQVKLFNYGSEDREKDMEFESEANMILLIFRLQLRMVLGDIDDGYVSFFSTAYLARYLATVRHLTDVASKRENFGSIDLSKSLQPNKRDYLLNTFYIITYDYICSRLYGDSKYSPASSSAVNKHLKSARKVLDLNIDLNNYFKMNDGRFIVYTPDCTFDRNSIIVLVSLMKPF